MAGAPQHHGPGREHPGGRYVLPGRGRRTGYDPRRLQGPYQRGQRVDHFAGEELRTERGGEAQGHLPAPRILLYAVPAEPASARQCRARQDRGQGRERRDDHRHPEEEGVGNDADRPSDRGALAHALPPAQRSSGIGAPFRFAGHPPHFCFCAPAVAVTAAGH